MLNVSSSLKASSLANANNSYNLRERRFSKLNNNTNFILLNIYRTSVILISDVHNTYFKPFNSCSACGKFTVTTLVRTN